MKFVPTPENMKKYLGVWDEMDWMMHSKKSAALEKRIQSRFVKHGSKNGND